MIENTSSLTNQLAPEGADSSNANLQKPSPKDLNLLDIPVFNSPQRDQPTSSPCSAPSSFDDGKMEYEFSFRWPNGTPAFVNLWDNNDVSACQRAAAAHLTAEDITYSKETGNGFFSVNGCTWTFKKEPFQRTYGPHNEIAAGTDEPEAPKKQRQTADDILATL